MQLKWIEEPPAELEARAGKPLHIPCRASGKPEPRMEWFKLGGDNHESDQMLGAEFQFGALAQEDSGVYECRARNGVEKDLRARVKLDVLGK